MLTVDRSCAEPGVRRSPSLIVLAKAPVAGRVKTRLTPPFSPEQAARMAHAALLDTLQAVAAADCARTVLVLDGRPGSWLPPGLEVIAQRGEGLAERLAAAFADVGAPALLVGMDTPQIAPALLRQGLDALGRDDVDAVLGPASDGGYWSVGMAHPHPGAFAAVPMSVAHTCAAQRARFALLGLRIFEQPTLRDVDVVDDARAVARLAPGSRFAAALAAAA